MRGKRMKNARTMRSSLLLILMLLGSLAVFSNPVPRVASLPSATVKVTPSTVAATPGQNFTVSIDVSDVTDLYGWEFKLSWNAFLLEVVKIVEGSFLKTRGMTYSSYNLNNTQGYMVAYATILGPLPGASGNGTLATMTFSVESFGECPLDLINATLVDSFEQKIPCQLLDGYGSFLYEHNVAITRVGMSANIGFPGDIITINATAQNQGRFAETFNVSACANSEAVGKQLISLGAGASTELMFTWNTSGKAKGDYVILASASVVPNEVDTADNNKTADSPVTLLYNGHDVAVIAVRSAKTVVGQGYCTLVTVTVKDHGIFSEVFNVTLSINATAIQTKTASLLSGALVELSFTWNTTSFAYGNYALKAEAELVPGEVYTMDNKLVGGPVLVSIPGDVAVSYRLVDIFDVVRIASGYEAVTGDPAYNNDIDINSDGIVDIFDVVTCTANYERSW